MTTVPSTGSNTDLASILAAAFDEFEMLRQAARQREDQDPDLFPGFLLAGSAAADGRNALVTAPSFPPGPPPARAKPRTGSRHGPGVGRRRDRRARCGQLETCCFDDRGRG